MKKIIFNTDSLIMGGAEKIAIEYLKLLNESKKFKIFLLINEDNGIERNILLNEIPPEIRYEYVVEKDIIKKLNSYREKKKNNIFAKILYNYFLYKRRKNYKKNIVKILKKEKYDYLMDFYCKVPIEVIDERAICWLHSSLKKIKNKSFYKEKFQKAKTIIVITEDMKKEFYHNFPFLKDKVKILYNFFDISEIKRKSIEYSEIDKKLQKLLDDNYILSCSRIDKNKDLGTLIKAFKIVKEKNFSIKEKLYIVGDGPEKKEIEKLVNKLKLQKEVIFLGTQLNPFIWMKNAELFVHSSKKEGFGMVLVEAMICETLVIATDCPVGPREILENGKNGILVEPENIKQLADKIEIYLLNKKLRTPFIENANTRIIEFSRENIKNSILRILE